VCIRYRGNVSTEPLPSNDRGIFTEPLPTDNRGGIHRHTDRQQRDLISLHILFFRIRKVCLKTKRTVHGQYSCGLRDNETKASKRDRIVTAVPVIKHDAMKTYGEVEVWLHIFLNLVPDRDECSDSSLGRFIPGAHRRAPEPVLTVSRKDKSLPMAVMEHQFHGHSTRSLVSILTSQTLNSSTLKMEAISSSETSGATERTTRRHIPENDTLHNHRCENLKSYIFNLLVSTL
jgi:hypothetical protein